MSPEDILRQFYKNNLCIKPVAPPHDVDLAVMGNRGLGDCTILTNIVKKAKETGRDIGIYCPSQHFPVLENEIPDYTSKTHAYKYVQVEYFEQYNYGNGHIIQKMQRGFGFNADIKPKGYLITSEKRKKRICLHLSTGASAFELSNQHDRPRQFYVEYIPILQKFIDKYSYEYEFVELGGHSLGLDNVNNQCGLSIKDSIAFLRESEYLVGLNSGFMNLAAALDVKSIILTNLPHVHQLYLPMLHDAPITDLTWLYPQNVHLGLDGENPLVPKISVSTLEQALNGEVYPYWSDKYLNLINEI